MQDSCAALLGVQHNANPTLMSENCIEHANDGDASLDPVCLPSQQTPSVEDPEQAPISIAARCAALPASLTRLPAVRAAIRYLRRRERLEHPAGGPARGGRWYPDASEGLNTAMYRTPSRAFPWSYMLPCRSIRHCAQLVGCDDILLVRRIARAIDEALSVEDAIQATKKAILARKGKVSHG